VARLWSFFRRFLRHRRKLVLGFLTIPAASLLDVWITVQIGAALDRLREASDTEFLRGLFWIILGIAAVRGTFRYLSRWWLVCVSRYVEVELKQELFDKLCSLPFSFHNRNLTGDIASRLTSDVENLRMFLGPGLMYVAGAFVMVPAALSTLLGLSPVLTLSMVVPLVLMGGGIALLTPRLQFHSTAVQERLAELSHRAQENFGGIRVIKGYGLERQQSERFEEVSRANRDHQIEFARARGLSNSVSETAHSLTFLPILLVGGMALIDRRMLVGDLFQFIDLTFKVFWPVIALGWMAGLYPRAIVSAQRVQQLLDEESPIQDPPQPAEPAAIRGSLALRDVSFRYPEAERHALRAIDVEVPAGTMLGIVGPTGSGKSTLLNLLGRLMEAEGTIALDGVPIRELRLELLRGALGYVPQDSFLFSESYRENVQFGSHAPLSEEQLRWLIDQAGMTREVAQFPGGIDQIIGERGVTLSGGQRQRTCIARALAADPRVLVLDDCLSAVDSETEAQLLDNLRQAGRGRTLIVAAHRLGTVMHAEQILVLREGAVEALGTHAELLQTSPWYRETWAQQQAQGELARL
jgi:ATP-binding cassette subfamily B multidrug efflux pump